MIRYALQCAEGHAFESWFRDSAAYDGQAEAGLLSCPACGSARVRKQIMAPSIAVQDEAAKQPMAMAGTKDHEIRAMLRAFRQHLETHAENVGADFADEARKIHYGEVDERAIYGVASVEEAKSLHEEGIGVLPVPTLPDEMN
jgi:hypothetical protein